jgi:N-acetylglucosaminyldiphosphoundecaprenol N-acetyl-beta-D-mannosaminyltransferase
MKEIRILGVRLDVSDANSTVDTLWRHATSGRGTYCVVSNAHQTVLAHDEPGHNAILENADLVVSDSTVLTKAASLVSRRRLPAARKGADLMLDLCQMAEAKSLRIGLLGGRDLDVLELLTARLVKQFPNLQVSFRNSPPFRELTRPEDDDLVDRIASSGSQLLFVGLGCPKQERWMSAHRDRLPCAMIGVGAAFDFNAGLVRASPRWVHRSGLEWAYRLAREPRRLWRRYLSSSPRFVYLLLGDLLKRGHPTTSRSQ